MKCRYCQTEMHKDNEEKRFKENKDIYWLCNKCNAACTEQIRFNQSYKEIWFKDPESYDTTIIKKQIARRNVNE